MNIAALRSLKTKQSKEDVLRVMNSYTPSINQDFFRKDAHKKKCELCVFSRREIDAHPCDNCIYNTKKWED
jgi:hypothetical protein